MPDALEIFMKKTAQQMGAQPDAHSGICLTLDENENLTIRSMDDAKKGVLVQRVLNNEGC